MEPGLRQRLGRLGAFLWGLVKGLGRGLGKLLGALGAGASKRKRLMGIERSIRDCEHQQRLIFENLGKMVYLLYKRNLVKNADLVAECEKATAIDAEIDGLIGEADRVRTARPEQVAADFPRLADRPAEVEAEAAAATVASETTV